MTVKEAAAYLGISEREVYDNLAPKGRLACYRYGRRIVIKEPDLLAFEAVHRCEPKGRKPPASRCAIVVRAASDAWTRHYPDDGLAEFYPDLGRSSRQ